VERRIPTMTPRTPMHVRASLFSFLFVRSRVADVVAYPCCVLLCSCPFLERVDSPAVEALLP
jgi:hypothetical protein